MCSYEKTIDRCQYQSQFTLQKKKKKEEEERKKRTKEESQKGGGEGGRERKIPKTKGETVVPF